MPCLAWVSNAICAYQLLYHMSDEIENQPIRGHQQSEEAL